MNINLKARCKAIVWIHNLEPHASWWLLATPHMDSTLPPKTSSFIDDIIPWHTAILRRKDDTTRAKGQIVGQQMCIQVTLFTARLLCELPSAQNRSKNMRNPF
tara:strand:- start:221 stop:529 length:309 start_codon:yes stop_codon:yes gene_type:complete